MLSSPTHPLFSVLSKENMISIKRRKKNGLVVEETVKPLEIIWSKFPQYTPQNTVHVRRIYHRYSHRREQTNVIDVPD